MSDEDISSLISPEIILIPRFLPKLKLAILASGKGSNFEALIKHTNKILDAEIKCLVVNKEESGAINIAKKYNINYKVLSHINYKSREDFDNAIINEFNNYEIDLVVMAGWMRIVTPVLINRFKKRIINIHPSLLPAFKGSNAIEDALNAKVKVSGCTAHIVEEEVDSGEILIQGVVPILSTDDLSSLSTKIQSIEHSILYKAIAIAAQKWRKYDHG